MQRNQDPMPRTNVDDRAGVLSPALARHRLEGLGFDCSQSCLIPQTIPGTHTHSARRKRQERARSAVARGARTADAAEPGGGARRRELRRGRGARGRAEEAARSPTVFYRYY